MSSGVEIDGDGTGLEGWLSGVGAALGGKTYGSGDNAGLGVWLVSGDANGLGCGPATSTGGLGAAGTGDKTGLRMIEGLEGSIIPGNGVGLVDGLATSGEG